MRKSILYFVHAFVLFVSLQAICGTAWAAGTVLLYSDLDWGPRTGWDNGVVKGAAVSIWGRNFGPAVSSSRVNIGGISIAATDPNFIAEWDVNGVARGDKRITFWIPPTATLGNQAITVTVAGVTSNALPFIVREGSGNIFYVSPTGSDSTTNGRRIATPYQNIWKAFNPCGPTDTHHAAGSCNPLQDGEYIVYVRGGTHTGTDPASQSSSYFLSMYGPYGGPTKRKALVGYPGETATVSLSGKAAFTQTASWSPFGPLDYFTYAKLYVLGGSATSRTFVDAWGYGIRVVGNRVKDLIGPEQSGVIFVGGGTDNTFIYGNVFDNCADPYVDGNMKHIIYVKAQDFGVNTGRSRSALNTHIGFNAFINNFSSSSNGGQIFLSRSTWNNGGPAMTNADYTDNVFIYNNYVSGGSQQILYAGDTTALNPNAGGGHYYFYNNIVNGGSTIFSTITAYCGGSYLISASNNTLYYPSTTPITFTGYCSTGTPSINMTNNILSATSASQYYQSLESGTTQTFAYDLYYNGRFSNGNTTPIPASSGGLTYTAGLIANPLMTNPGAADFTLQASSPAIDNGMNLWNTNAYLPFGRYDYEGKLRPSSGAWDIGAIQYDAGPPPPDTTAPAAVSNLSASNPTANSVTLNWTATGNDGTSGTATSYDIRYSTSPITPTSWTTGAVTQITGEPAPQPVGTDQNMLITGLSPSTQYYFAMTVSDAIPNTSSISNVAIATTLSGTVNPPPAAPQNVRISP